MVRKFAFFSLLFLLLSGVFTVVAQSDVAATTTSTLNVRGEPSKTGVRVGRLAPHTAILVEGRNEAGDWLLVHNQDSSIRGWVAIGFVQFADAIRVQDLPLKTDIVAAPPANPPAVAGGNGTTTVDIPPEPLDNPVVDLNSAVLRNVRAIFNRGQQLGNAANSFMKLGESNTGGTVYMCTFEWGKYDLGTHTELQGIVDAFNLTQSFCRTNMTAGNGYSTATVLDPLWAPADQCQPTQSPLVCEIAKAKPSFAFIYFGIADMGTITADQYRQNLNTIIRTLSNSGVVPIISTFPMSDKFNDGKPQQFNKIIRQVAADRHIPLIDLRIAVWNYTDHGTGEDGYHLSVRTADETTFTGDENTYGRTMRELLSLQILYDLSNAVNQK
ncbi:MAG: GDSL-type esterase/lipase family protein [Chloroflexota bacterium]